VGGQGFLVDAFIFLAAAVVVVPLAKRGGLGAVLGYLLAGIVVGPHGSGLINHPQDILHFAEVGVVLMLFLIGLELQPTMLWQLRRPIIGLGGAQVLLTGAAITGVAILLGTNWRTGITLGIALALSSTAIGLQLLTERGQLRTAAGRSAFAVLLFQDIAVVPMLAILPLLGAGVATEESGPLAMLSGWQHAMVVLSVMATIVLAGRFLLRPIFRFIAATGMREIFTAFSLFLVIGIALLMQELGLSPALGAFLAGVILATSEYRHAVETDIEPFKGLLLGLFFISVGMSIDFGLIGADPVTILGLAAGLVALKLAILAPLGSVFGLRGGENAHFTFLLAQGGEFAFVLLQFAVGQGAVTAAIASQMTVVVALSMVITPLLMILNERHVQPRLSVPRTARAPDVIDQAESAVLIVGYGRFGQIVGRLLQASGVAMTVLDNDPDHLEVLRRFGHKAFYGDGSRLDVLRAAGAERAKLIILAMNHPETTVETAKAVRQNFPHLKILARARDRNHAFELMAAGADIIRRETFDAALRLGSEALVLLGSRPSDARHKAETFAEHDTNMLLKGFELQADEASMIALVRRARDELEQIFRADRGAAPHEDGDSET